MHCLRGAPDGAPMERALSIEPDYRVVDYSDPEATADAADLMLEAIRREHHCAQFQAYEHPMPLEWHMDRWVAQRSANLKWWLGLASGVIVAVIAVLIQRWL